jgi:proteasome component ECM29
MNLLSESKEAANLAPMVLQLICFLIFSTNTSASSTSRPRVIMNRMKLAGITFSIWSFSQCKHSILESFLGVVLFPSFLRLLSAPEIHEDTNDDIIFLSEFRIGIYKNLEVLGNRAPCVLADSIQLFQMILFRCLKEEQRSNSNGAVGAVAIHTFRSLATAFADHGSEDTKNKIKKEIMDVIQGEEVLKYKRLLEPIAQWCTLLMNPEADVDIRFALIRLIAVEIEGQKSFDEKHKQIARTGLFMPPMPSSYQVVKFLDARFSHHDLKHALTAKAIQLTLEFCLQVMKDNSQHDAKKKLLLYFLETLLNVSNDTAASETAAQCLVQMQVEGLIDKEWLALALIQRLDSLFNNQAFYSSTSFSSERNNYPISILIGGAVNVLPLAQTIEQALVPLVNRLLAYSNVSIDDEIGVSTLCITLGCCLSAVDARLGGATDERWDGSYEDPLLKAYGLLVSRLAQQLETLKHPKQHAILNNYIQSVGNAGSIVQLCNLANSGRKWILLKRQTLHDLVKIITQLDLKKFISNDSFRVSSKQIAIENLSRIVGNLQEEDLSDAIRKNLLNFGTEELVIQEHAEVQFAIGEAIVSLGDGFDERCINTLQLIVDRYALSRHVKHRRPASVWLACIVSTLSLEKVHNSWSHALQNNEGALLLKVHDVLVDMLRDNSSPIVQESAVKALGHLYSSTAGISTKSSIESLAKKMSDTLFRRLRCFRTFTSQQQEISEEENTTANEGNQQRQQQQRQNDSSQATSSTSAAVDDVVENPAYREVSNVAAIVGDAHLMYMLLYLSTTDPIWVSFSLEKKKHLNYLFWESNVPFKFVVTDAKLQGTIMEQISWDVLSYNGDQMKDEKRKATVLLAQWLYLLKNHSHSKVQAVMAHLWSVIIPSSKEKGIVKEHWAVLLEFLLSTIDKSRQFKYREAACKALMDLLHGSEANDVRQDLSRIWRLTCRAVDDVMEAVSVVGLKLFKYVGEMSLRIAAADSECRHMLMDFLVDEGIIMRNVICRALSFDLLLRLVKDSEAESIERSLAKMILKCLEYLSSLELPELQYAQFHVEKKDALEKLRISLSQAGPVGQLLEICTTHLKQLSNSSRAEQTIEDICPGVCNLLRFGVGLNTRVGTANFVATLCVDLPFEMRKTRGAEQILRKALFPFIRTKTLQENEDYSEHEDVTEEDVGLGLKDGLVIQAYSRAAAYACALIDSEVIRMYVCDGIFAQTKEIVVPESADEKEMLNRLKTSCKSRYQMVCAIATKFLVSRNPLTIENASKSIWYMSHVFPGAFIGQFASSKILRDTWVAVFEELPPSVRYAEASMEALLICMRELLLHSSWSTRRQATSAIAALFSPSFASYAKKISSAQRNQLAHDMMECVPWRLWRGKGMVLEALVALTSYEYVLHTMDKEDKEIAVQLSDLLLNEIERGLKNTDMSYMESAVSSVGKLSSYDSLLDLGMKKKNICFLRHVLDNAILSTHSLAEDQGNANKALPPLLINCLFENIALCWPDFKQQSNPHEEEDADFTVNILQWLSNSLEDPDLQVWSIRKAIFTAMASVVRGSSTKSLSVSRVMSMVIQASCSQRGIQDLKYGSVRITAATVLEEVTKRKEPEWVMCYVVLKENILDALKIMRSSQEPSEQRVIQSIFENLM